jgi:hypothetical protein
MDRTFSGFVYHSRMRSLFLALLIALLPLRGWVGDVMAMELVAPALVASATPAAAHASHHAATGACDHGAEHHAPAQAGEPAAATPAGTGDCGTCTACQICHSVALAPMLHQLPAPQLALAAPQSRLPQDVSAERAPGDKPPID